MKRLGKWGVFALAAVGIATVACRFAVSQQPDYYGELFAKAQPHLEEALGAKLGFTPVFRRTANADIQATPDYSLEAHVRWHFPQLKGDTLTRTQQIARQIVGSATVAQYVEGRDVIVVAGENIPKIATWDEALAPAGSEAFLQLALVHEAVRWHLDRRFQLAKLRAGCRDAEESDTLQTLIEGYAQAVTYKVAGKLGSTAVFPLLAKRYLRVPDEAPDPLQKAVSQTSLHARYRACTQGSEFFRCLDEAGVSNPSQRVFTQLPKQMTMLARPACWIEANGRNQPDLATVLQPLESALPASAWQPQQQTWTPLMLSQVAAMLGAPPERVEKVTKTWYEGRSLIWSHRSQPDRQVALTVVRHDHEAGARAYFGFAVDLQRQQDTLTPGATGPLVQVVESKSTAVQLDGFDEAARTDKRIAYGNAKPMPVSLLLARSGNLVIECTWHGQATDAALGTRLVQEVRATAK